MDISVPTVEQALTFAGLSILTTAIVEIILRAWQPDGSTKDRFGPLLALAVALIIVIAAAFYQQADLFTAVLTAIMVGWASMGVHDTARTAATAGG